MRQIAKQSKPLSNRKSRSPRSRKKRTAETEVLCCGLHPCTSSSRGHKPRKCEEIPPLLKTSQQFLVGSTEPEAHSEKSMNVSDVEVTDEDGNLSRSKTIKANNNILKERIWITVKSTIQNRVRKDDFEPNATRWTSSRS